MLPPTPMAASLRLKLHPICPLNFHIPSAIIPNKLSYTFRNYFPLHLEQTQFKIAAAAGMYVYRSFENAPDDEQIDENLTDLDTNGAVYKKTLRLVECSMFAAVSGLVYFISNSLSIENYFGCFFPLPIVISAIRWGSAAGRKTMVATAMLLFVISGPLKAIVYLMTHGVVGFTMGVLWRYKASWDLSILICTFARAAGAVGYVLLTSFLIRENILALITINIHASLTFISSATGINMIPSLTQIYILFGILVLLNSALFMFLLHLLFAVFLTRLGMKDSLKLPKWVQNAL